MTGHIERRVDGKGRAHFRFVVRQAGSGRRITTSWRSLQREAKDDGEQLLESLGKPPQSSETVAQLLERFMRDHCLAQVAETTRYHYRIAIDEHITSAWLRSGSEAVQMGEILAAELRSADVAEWQAQLLASGRHDGQGLAPKSVRGYRGVLSAAYSWAVRLGDYQANPVSAVKPPKLKRARLEPPQMATVQQYVAALEGTRYRIPVLLAAGTGMRRGEVLAQRWCDLDLAQGVLHVRRQLRQAGTAVREAAPKTEAGNRDLPLPPFLLAALQAEKQRQKGQATIAGEHWSEEGTICAPMKPDALTHGLLATLKRRGLPPIGMHKLRHALASAMLAGGIGVLEVQAQLGHTDSATTVGIYGHLMPGALPKAMARVGELWEEALAPTASGEVVDFAHARDTKTKGE